MSTEPQWGTPPSDPQVHDDGVEDRKPRPRRLTGGEFRLAVADWVVKTRGTTEGAETAAFWVRMRDADPMDDDVSQDLADEWVSIRTRLGDNHARPVQIIAPHPDVAGSRLAAMGDPYYTRRERTLRFLAWTFLGACLVLGLSAMVLAALGKLSPVVGLFLGLAAPFVGWVIAEATFKVGRALRHYY